MNLSIITISKDDCDGLAASLQSAERLREIEAVEQIVVATGSSLSIKPDSSVVVVEQEGAGISSAFNEGLAAASGEWIWFLNGGDRVHPDLDVDWLMTLLRTTKADIVTCGIQYDGDPDFRPIPPLVMQWPPLYCWLAHPATIMRREKLDAAGGFDTRWRIAMDFDLWLKVLPRNVLIDTVSVPLAVFDTGGISQRPDMQSRVRRETGRVFLRHAPWLIKTWTKIGLRLARQLWRAVWGR